jgi:tetratricopeptide (TPR) repeat protein
MHIMMLYCIHKEFAEAEKWVRTLERLAHQNHDLVALHEAHYYRGTFIFHATGDTQRALREFHLSHELARKSGYPFLELCSSRGVGAAYLSLGDLQRAQEFSDLALQCAESASQKGRQLIQLGIVLFCRGSRESAAETFEKARQFHRDAGESGGQWRAARAMGWVRLAQGEREAAVRQFSESLALAGGNAWWLAEALSGIEEAYQDCEAFFAWCRRLRDEHPELSASSQLQWHLEPGEPRAIPSSGVQEPFARGLSAAWIWHDPFADCRFEARDGLEIHAANDRDLWHANLSAPRLIQPVWGDLAVQTVCAPVFGEKPAIGGLCLWKDRENFLRLDAGTRGKHEISSRDASRTMT